MSLLVLGGVVGGCNFDSQVATEPAATIAATNQETANSAAAEEMARAVAGRKARGAEDDILRLEAIVPGIGGAYIDRENGKLIVLSVNPSFDDRAEQAASAMVRGLSIRDDVSRVEVRRAEFTFSELVGWKTVLLQELINLPGFVSIDVDERSNRIRIGISSEDARLPVLHGVQTAGLDPTVVNVVVEPPPQLLAKTYLDDRYRPTGGGLQISLYPATGGCTHGWSVSTNQAESGFLTASHCVSYGSGTASGSFTQPGGTNDVDDLVGSVSLNEPWDLTTCDDPELGGAWNGDCARADVLFVESSEAAKRIALTRFVGTNSNEGSTELDQFWVDIGDVATAWVGMYADKVGYVTGWTRGTVTQTCKDVKVPIPGGGHFVVLCSGLVDTAKACNGDSGSPVFKGFAGSDIRPLGILFAGLCSATDAHFYYSDFYNIRLHLGRTFDPAVFTPELDINISGPSSVYPGANCTWSVIRTGGDYPFTYQWSGILSGSLSQVSGAISSSGWLHVTVMDDAMSAVQDSMFVSRTSYNPECGGGGGGGPEEVVGKSGG